MHGRTSSLLRIGFVYRDVLRGGGYPRDVRWLASALASHGVSVTLFAGAGWNTEGLAGVRVEPLEHLGRLELDVYHIFGIFIPRHLWILRKILGKAIVVSPLGQLMAYHLERKATRKSLYLRLVKPLLRRVEWFHVFSGREERSVKEHLGNNVLTFEAALGVFPIPAVVAQAEQIVENYNVGLDLLFLGRNDVYQKGIDVLLEGYALARKDGANARLTIAGQPWGDSERYIRSLVERYGLSDKVRVLGAVDEEMKWRLMAGADYLAFLSRWDGPPRPVREAIAVGTPVIVSAETNMGGLVEEYEAGLQVQLTPEKVANAIARASANGGLWRRHREGVIRLRERLEWSRVARDYIQGYEQVLALNR